MNTAKEKLNKELSSIEPDAIIELFEIDFSSLQNHVDMLRLQENLNIGAEPIYRFHPGINSTNPIYWQDNGYQPLPITMEDFESKSDGTLPRPKMTILNVDGLLSRIVSSNDDFVGCQITRKRTFAKFLDAQNFQNRNLNEETGENPFGSTDPQAHLADDVFFVNRKVAENKEAVQFELASALELGDTRLPSRIVLHNYCTWKYRCSTGCRYAGAKALPKADVNDKNFVIRRDASGVVVEEGYGLASLNVVNMITDVFEWNPNGTTQLGDGSWKKGSVGNQYGYNRGDVVKMLPSYSKGLNDNVEMVFVCLKTHSEPSRFHPLNSTGVWVRDNCSRGIEGCIMRFGYNEPITKDSDSGTITSHVTNGSNGGIDERLEKKPMDLPFGGFPGTSQYGF